MTRAKTDGAIAHYRQAIELRPSYAEAHYNLGRLLAQKGQLGDAITHYRKSTGNKPRRCRSTEQSWRYAFCERACR